VYQMIDINNKDYIVILQCDIVKQRCPGYLCEKAFTERTGGFANYPTDKQFRVINMSCGGCCGKATHRKLTLFKRTIKKKENIEKNRILVQLSSCMTKDNYHSTPCPHLDYIKDLIAKIGIDIMEDTVISERSEDRRKQGIYKS
jgi:predicted metal-binding protein